MKKFNKLMVDFFGVRIGFIAAFAVVAFFAMSQLGCIRIKAGKIIDGVNTVIDVAETVCSASVLFEDRLPVDPEKCATYINNAVELQQDGKVNALVSVARCVDKHKKDSVSVAQCVDDIDGWKVIIKELK